MSSEGGSSSSGNRCRIASTMVRVSSTDSVVWDSQATFAGSRTTSVGDVVGGLHELDVLGGLAGGALDLLVPLVADQQDVVVLVGEPPGLVVHLGDERAGGVDGLQRPLLGLPVHLRGHAVGGEHHGGARGHLGDLLDEDGPAGLEVGHHVLVVHDLLAHVDRRAVQVERLLDRDHGPVDTGAVAARRGEQHRAVGLGRVEDRGDPQVGRSHATHRRCWPVGCSRPECADGREVTWVSTRPPSSLPPCARSRT